MYVFGKVYEELSADIREFHVDCIPPGVHKSLEFCGVVNLEFAGVSRGFYVIAFCLLVAFLFNRELAFPFIHKKW